MKYLNAVISSAAVTTLLLISCAPKRTYTPIPVPGWEYIANELRGVPLSLSESDRRTFERGWDALVRDDLATAAENLEKLARRQSQNASVQAALGYLELRLGDRVVADQQFMKALRLEPSMGAAQAGRFLTAMAAGREEIAFERLRDLKGNHPEHVLVRHYLSPLQLKLAEAKLQAARSAKHQERYGEAAELYRETLRVAPEAAGLYLETAEAELLNGEAEAAAGHAAQAAELEPDNALAHRLHGDALRQMGNFEDAIEAYREALALRADDLTLTQLINETRRELRRESLPAQFSDIENAERVSREDLAALLYVRLRSFLETDEAAQARVIATDIADSWAREFIRAIVATEIMSVYPNHTFQPKAFVRKADLAGALIAAWDALAPANDGSPPMTNDVIRDLSPENLRYRPAAVAVSLGLLTTDSEGRFEPQRFVTGLEAIAAVEALAERLVP